MTRSNECTAGEFCCGLPSMCDYYLERQRAMTNYDYDDIDDPVVFDYEDGDE